MFSDNNPKALFGISINGVTLLPTNHTPHNGKDQRHQRDWRYQEFCIHSQLASIPLSVNPDQTCRAGSGQVLLDQFTFSDRKIEGKELTGSADQEEAG